MCMETQNGKWSKRDEVSLLDFIDMGFAEGEKGNFGPRDRWQTMGSDNAPKSLVGGPGSRRREWNGPDRPWGRKEHLVQFIP